MLNAFGCIAHSYVRDTFVATCLLLGPRVTPPTAMPPPAPKVARTTPGLRLKAELRDGLPLLAGADAFVQLTVEVSKAIPLTLIPSP